MTDPTTAVEQELTDEQIDVLRRYGSERDVEAGDVLFRPGDAVYDLIVVLPAQSTWWAARPTSRSSSCRRRPGASSASSG